MIWRSYCEKLACSPDKREAKQEKYINTVLCDPELHSLQAIHSCGDVFNSCDLQKAAGSTLTLSIKDVGVVGCHCT